jgi:hypothetical protein
VDQNVSGAVALKVVIDTNSLQTDELWAFLSMSQHNLAILPDYVLMESFKSGRTDGIRSAFSILGRFPGQVVALKATGEVSLLDPDRVAMSKAMVSAEETQAFPNFFGAISGDEKFGALDAQLALRGQWAREQMDRMLTAFADMAPAMEEFVAPFTAAELRLIRQSQPFRGHRKVCYTDGAKSDRS